jgi:hypothetical protein
MANRAMIIFSAVFVFSCAGKYKPGTGDMLLPFVVSTSPVDGKKDISLDSGINVTFSESVQAQTINQQSFYVQEQGKNVEGTLSYDDASLTAAFKPAALLTEGRTYTVILTRDILDINSLPLNPVPLTEGKKEPGTAGNFTFSFETQKNPPFVKDVKPANNAKDVKKDVSKLEVTFSEPVDDATVNGETFHSDGSIKGLVSYDPDTSSAAFAFSESLKEGRTYTFFIEPAIKDIAGIPLLMQERFSFTVEVTVPEVTETLPSSDAKDMDVNLKEIHVKFSEKMNKQTVIGKNFSIFPPVEGEWTYNDESNEAVFAIKETLTEDTAYIVTAHSQITDADGISLNGDFGFSFTTIKTIPFVKSTNPQKAQENVATDIGSIQIQFSEPMDPVTIDETSVMIDLNENYSVSYEENSQTAFINFGNLISNVTYSVTVLSSVSDLDGIQMQEDYAFSFKTADIPDNNPPSAITDLKITVKDRNKFVLNFTWPGEDVEKNKPKGKVTKAELRVSEDPLWDASKDFGSGKPVSISISPMEPGEAGELTANKYSLQFLTLIGVSYYFAIKVEDDAGNISISNSAEGTPGFVYSETHGKDNDQWTGYSVLTINDADGKGMNILAVGSPRASYFSQTESNESGQDADTDTGKQAEEITEAGQVDIFVINSDGTIDEPLFTIYGKTPLEHFGSSLSSGDFDGDSKPDLAVGATGLTNEEGKSVGGFYLFKGGHDAWKNGESLIVKGSEIDGLSGLSLLSVKTASKFYLLAVGSPGAFATHTGLVTLYSFDSQGNVTNTVLFTGKSGGDEFGISLYATYLNYDNYLDLIVGAPQNDSGGLDAGAVYIYKGSEDGFKSDDFVALNVNAPGARFGSSFAGNVDLDGDSLNDLLTGAPRYSGQDTNDVGAVYLLKGSPDFSSSPEILLSGNETGSRFGYSISIMKNLTSDSYPDIVISAPNASYAGGKNNGVVFFFQVSDNLAKPPAYHGSIYGASFSNFGFALNIPEDINGDSLSDIVVSAPFSDNAAQDSGSVYVFR